MAALPKLCYGEIVDGKWKIIEKLGEGGFGAVYKVVNNLQGDQIGALKIESVNVKVRALSMEVSVMQSLQENNSRHFCKIFGLGKTNDFYYVAMTLVSSSLQTLRKERKEQHFTLPTSVRVGIQCLEGIEELHKIGYLHRDVKPGNFAVGRKEVDEHHTIYVLDFGMCRRYTNKEGKIRHPRAKAAFRGTIRYAPLACHQQKEFSPKDDVETWFYQQVEITKGALPWKHVTDKDVVGRWKENARKPAHPVRIELFKACPDEYQSIFQYIEKLTYYDTVNYENIYNVLNNMGVRYNITAYQPYDWEIPEGSAPEYQPIQPQQQMPQQQQMPPQMTRQNSGNHQPKSTGRSYAPQQQQKPQKQKQQQQQQKRVLGLARRNSNKGGGGSGKRRK